MNRRGIRSVLIFINADRPYIDLIIVEIRIVGSCRHHRGVRAAPGSAGRHKIIDAAGKIPEKDIVFYKADGVLLVHQAAGSIAGIIQVAVLVPRHALFPSVPAGNIDVSLFGISRLGQLVLLLTVSGRARINNNRRCVSRIILPVCAGHVSRAVNHEGSLHRTAGFRRGHVRFAVPVGIDTRNIGSGHADGYTFLIGKLRIGHSGHNGKRPGIRRGAVGPFLVLILLQVKHAFDLTVLIGIRRPDHRIGCHLRFLLFLLFCRLFLLCSCFGFIGTGFRRLSRRRRCDHGCRTACLILRRVRFDLILQHEHGSGNLSGVLRQAVYFYRIILFIPGFRGFIRRLPIAGAAVVRIILRTAVIGIIIIIGIIVIIRVIVIIGVIRAAGVTGVIGIVIRIVIIIIIRIVVVSDIFSVEPGLKIFIGRLIHIISVNPGFRIFVTQLISFILIVLVISVDPGFQLFVRHIIRVIIV